MEQEAEEIRKTVNLGEEMPLSNNEETCVEEVKILGGLKGEELNNFEAQLIADRHNEDVRLRNAKKLAKDIAIVILASFVNVSSFATPSITSVTAQQWYPWNGKVDLSYTVSGDVASHCRNYGLIPSLKVTATDKVVNKTYTATKLEGDTELTDGTHRLVWDLDAQGLAIKSLV